MGRKVIDVGRKVINMGFLAIKLGLKVINMGKGNKYGTISSHIYYL